MKSKWHLTTRLNRGLLLGGFLLSIATPGAVCQGQIFRAPEAFPAGSNPVAEATGDFNGDGKMDVAVANNSSATVSVMLGNGDGTFQPFTNLAVGNGPSAIVAGDFNGDGKVDLAVANSTDGTVSILLGKGDGTFQTAVNYAVTVGACCMTMSDFNGDGRLDLAVNAALNGSTQYMSVLLGNGDGTFQPTVNYQSGYFKGSFPYFSELNSASIASADFNGDGKADLLLVAASETLTCTKIPPSCKVTSSANWLELFVGNGDGTFQTYQQLGTIPISALTVGDFNSDGKLDIAASSSSGAAILLGNGDGTFQSPVTYQAGIAPIQVVAGDLNSDGKLDLAVTNTTGGVSVLLGNGDGTFQAATDYAAGPSLSAITIGDVNRDGKGDLVVANNMGHGTVTVLLGKGDGTFLDEPPEVQLGAVASPLSVAAGDFNGDGKLDFVVADLTGVNFGSPGISVVLGNGDGTFQPASFTPIVDYAGRAGVAADDLNGDGKLDLAVATGGPNLLVYLGNGDGTFQPAVNYSTSDFGSTVAVADLNADNKPDLAVTDGNGHVDILLGNGDGTFKPAVSYSSGQPCNLSVLICDVEVPAIGDFNGDGKLDLAVPDVAASTVNILLGNGDGTFQAPVTYPVGLWPISVGVGDFNGDSKSDLAVANMDGTVSILLGKGNGTFQPAVSYQIAITIAGPALVMVGDFNGDGMLDLVIQGDGLVSVLLGKGDGTFQPQLNHAFGDYGPGGIAAGDFDGDYTTDLVVGGGFSALGNSTATVLLNIAGFYLYVTESGAGGGTVTSSPSGINCSGTCSASFAGGATVTLTATPNATSNFTGWSGACSGTGACAITMKAATRAAANFTLQDFSLSPAANALTLQIGGQATDVMTLTGIKGPFSSAIQLTCAITGPAPMPTCALSATSVTPGSNSVTSTLTITAPTTAALQLPLGRPQFGRSLSALWLPLMLGITLVGGAKKRHGRYGLFCGLLLLLFLQAACGGSSSSGSRTPPPTNYTVTVTGTAGVIPHATQVIVTVQ